MNIEVERAAVRPLMGSCGLLAALLVVPVIGWAAPPLSGAIFTTTVDGDVVNENVRYEAKEDVYLDGGPGPNAPISAAGLPEGDYYYQVTDPSGKDLLSTDHISCRMIHVSSDGVIDEIYRTGSNYEFSNKDKEWQAADCFDLDGDGTYDVHLEGVDLDHGDEGAVTVQLFPYDDTPNPGGVYKAWITPVGDYTCDDGAIDAAADKKTDVNGEDCDTFHGFRPAASKTDNYKVKYKGKPFVSPEIAVYKFHDADMDGSWDTDEEEVTGWEVYVTDTLGVENTELTTAVVVAGVAGDYLFEEETPESTAQTVALLDGLVESAYPTADPVVTVTVAGTSGETHEVIFGNVGLGTIDPCKVYDRDGDGVWDEEDEPFVTGWQFTLTGYDLLGDYHEEVVYTDETGCAEFGDVFPGTYTVTEGTPTDTGWYATGDLEVEVTVESSLSGSTILGTITTEHFTNGYVAGPVDFGTKGYWHNKNGLTVLDGGDDADSNGVPDIIDWVNTLDPYDDATSYFGDGDEGFDGYFDDGTEVDAAYKDDDGSEIWGGGTWQAEVSLYLVDTNAGGDPAEQLGQQLLAFIFNAYFELDCVDAVIEASDGTLYSASGLIDDAIDAWTSGTAAEQTAIKDVLDAFNNMDEVYYSPCTPPEPTF